MSQARIAGFALLVAGAAVGMEASTFEVSFPTDPIGPKALPYVVALLLLWAGIHSAVWPKVDVSWPPRRVTLRLTAAAGAFLVYPVALPVLGFVLSTTLVVAALASLYGAPRKRGLAAAAALSVALWVLFVQALSLPLPIGSLWIR